MDEVAPTSEQISFLAGGDEGTFTKANTLASSVKIEDETLPAFGIIRLENVKTKGLDYDNQLFFPFGGFESTFGEGYNYSGNAATHTPVKLRTRIYPNLELIKKKFPGTQAVRLIPLFPDDNNAARCVLFDDGALRLQPFAANPESCEQSRISLADFESTYSAIQWDFDLASFPDPTEVKFAVLTVGSGSTGNTFFQPIAGQAVPASSASGSNQPAFILLGVHANELASLPEGTISSSGFNPTRDGFGFMNLGDRSFDLFTLSDYIDKAGKEKVCFIQNGECVGLNGHGLWLQESYFNVKGGLCYGFSFASSALFDGLSLDGKQLASDYNPLAGSAVELNYSDIRHTLGKQQLGQFSDAAQAVRGKCASDPMLPSEAIARIEAGFSDPSKRIAALSFAKLDRTGGHAVTPYAVASEAGSSHKKRIYVYDNNFPADMDRYFQVDTTPGQESWSYSGSTNAASAENRYEGFGRINPLCTEPLSLADDLTISVQPIGSTLFVDRLNAHSQVVDPAGNVSGADLATMANVNNIPNATLSQYIGQNRLQIEGLGNSNVLFKEPFNLEAILGEMYTVNARFSEGTQFKNFSMAQSSTLVADVAVNLEVLTTEVAQLDPSETYTIRTHPSARAIAFEEFGRKGIQTVNLKMAFTNQVAQRTYRFKAALTTDALTSRCDSIAVLVADPVADPGDAVTFLEYQAADPLNTLQPLPKDAYQIGFADVVSPPNP